MTDWTSTRLADALDGMICTHPDTVGTTAAMSMLDEASFPFRSQSPEVAEAQTAFSAARCGFKSSYSPDTGRYSHERWSDAVQAGSKLAAALRSLGDIRIVRCEKPSHRGGVCGMPIRPDGTCGYLHEGEETAGARPDRADRGGGTPMRTDEAGRLMVAAANALPDRMRAASERIRHLAETLDDPEAARLTSNAWGIAVRNVDPTDQAVTFGWEEKSG